MSVTDDGREPAKTPAHGISRRNLLGGGAAMVAGAGLAATAARAQDRSNTRETREGESVAGRTFRGLVSDEAGSHVEELTLMDLGERDCLIRMEATAVSYTMLGTVLGTSARPLVIGQGGVGVCEAVGPMVKRVAVGDRVLISATAQCGWCYQCLHGRPDWCQFSQTSGHPFATTGTGVEVTPRGGIGGTSELTFAPEEHCTPIFTDLPAPELAMIVNQVGCGFAAGQNQAPIEPGSDVVVFGAGPVGMGGILAARTLGAARIVVVEPIAARRENATALGATHTIDPNDHSEEELLEVIRDICKGRTDRRFAGGRLWDGTVFGQDGRGADFVIEAVGATRFPVDEAPADLSGTIAIQQAWAVARAGGHITLLGAAQGDVTFPAVPFALNGRTIHEGQMGGQHPMRDLPRFIEMMEKGTIDLSGVVTTFGLDEAVAAHQAVADRSILAGAIVFS